MKRRVLIAGLMLASNSAWGQISIPSKSAGRRAVPTCVSGGAREMHPQAAGWKPPDTGLRPEAGSAWWKNWMRELTHSVENYRGLTVKIDFRTFECEHDGRIESRRVVDATIFREQGQKVSYALSAGGVLISFERRSNGRPFSGMVIGSLDGAVTFAICNDQYVRSANLGEYKLQEAPFLPEDEVKVALRFWTQVYWLSLSELAERVGMQVPEEISIPTLLKGTTL